MFEKVKVKVVYTKYASGFKTKKI